MREREEGLAAPGSHVSGDRFLAPSVAAGTRWEGEQQCHSTLQRKSLAGVLLWLQVAFHGATPGEEGGRDGPPQESQ